MVEKANNSPFVFSSLPLASEGRKMNSEMFSCVQSDDKRNARRLGKRNLDDWHDIAGVNHNFGNNGPF
jgi:hypothetical protein